MSHSRDAHQELASTYFVQDRSNKEDLCRLHIQDHLVTAGMGGVLPEQPDPTIFERVLDVGCGPGGWLIEAAKTYPRMKLLVGMDISDKMLQAARSQAAAQQMSDRVQFHTMDAFKMLEFPSGGFDLVNQRFGMSWVRTWDWPKLLGEYQRVSRPGGVIRITESDVDEGSYPALNRLSHLLLQTFYQAGHFFTPDSQGLTSQLAPLLCQYGLRNVQTQVSRMHYRAGTAQWQSMYEELRRLFRVAVPFMRKWTHVPEDYEEIYQQAMSEMQQPDFVGTWTLLTAWGNTPSL
ncbi:MAG: class I SAM-dependent methyltransferase [Chloroflexi bacterium]|nr:class I SAM-dependent methyltransferase [Chloroflexota bacterium]